MRSGIWVLCGFAAAWGIWGILASGWPSWLAAVPLAISALVAFLAGRRSFQVQSSAQGRHIGRLIFIWSMFELVAIPLSAMLLTRYELRPMIPAAAAIIVGVHFIPLARGIPAPDYYATGVGLIVIGIVALFLAPPLTFQVAAFGAALVLWATALRVIGRGDRA